MGEMRLPAMSSHMIRNDQAMEVWAGSRLCSVCPPAAASSSLSLHPSIPLMCRCWSELGRRGILRRFVSSSLTQHRGVEPADTQEPARVDPSQPPPPLVLRKGSRLFSLFIKQEVKWTERPGPVFRHRCSRAQLGPRAHCSVSGNYRELFLFLLLNSV